MSKGLFLGGEGRALRETLSASFCRTHRPRPGAPCHPSPVKNCELARDNRLVTSSYDGSIAIWDLKKVMVRSVGGRAQKGTATWRSGAYFFLPRRAPAWWSPAPRSRSGALPGLRSARTNRRWLVREGRSRRRAAPCACRCVTCCTPLPLYPGHLQQQPVRQHQRQPDDHLQPGP